MWNWTLEASVKTGASEEAIWKLWTDVSSWPEWDHELDWCSIEGPFVVGASGKLKPKGWMVTRFTLTHVEKNRGFADLTRMPLTSVIFRHSYVNGKLTHRVEVKGLLAPFLRLTMGKKIEKEMPKAIAALAKKAEE